MRIVSWNVARKALWPHAFALRPAIAVLQEAPPVPTDDHRLPHRLEDSARGIAIASLYPLTVIAAPAPSCLAALVHGPEGSFALVAICSRRPKNGGSYNVVNRAAIEWIAERLPKSGNAIFAGDFNASAAFDHRYPALSHSTNVAHLAKLGFSSSLHAAAGIQHGAEPMRYITFRRVQRGKLQAFTIDHVFSRGFVIEAALVGDARGSDHSPVIVDLGY
ncbi:endonuclease/exonuclease/phosphatase family protein [Salinarimonas rosea]|uniref:endonuclease/exonuclease/phosphatase family protein n=1 Tax=Salinarimonas rosea TaxID=552063 RepID=UPI00048A6FF7|nr:endonuclease/exonuclease/phosphatase family protein [Salinarimonas rosea]